MSKAFVKEPDSEADLPYEPPAIPAGIKNYMTPQGHRQMQDELHQLLRVEPPKKKSVPRKEESGRHQVAFQAEPFSRACGLSQQGGKRSSA